MRTFCYYIIQNVQNCIVSIHKTDHIASMYMLNILLHDMASQFVLMTLSSSTITWTSTNEIQPTPDC